VSRFFKRTQSVNETAVPHIAPSIDAVNLDKLLETINHGVDDQVASLDAPLFSSPPPPVRSASHEMPALSIAEFSPECASDDQVTSPKPSLAVGSVATTRAASREMPAVSAEKFSPERAVVEAQEDVSEQVLSLERTPQSLVGRRYQPGSQVSVFAYEQYRVLRTRLQAQLRSRSIRTLLVTSAMQGEGKSTVASNLAFVMSQLEGRKVLLVDADLRRPTVANVLGLNVPRGLSSYLTDGFALNQVRWRIEPQLSVVATAPVDSGAAELLSSERMKAFLQEAKQAHDLVILDGPPLFPIADAQVLARLVDAALLVVGAGLYPAEVVNSAADLLRPKLLGAVLNGVERLQHTYSRYGYGGYGQPSGPRHG